MGRIARIALMTTSVLASCVVYGYYKKQKKKKEAGDLIARPPLSWKPSSRQTIVRNMKTKIYDVLVIGGGISGAGCALDAATRGLKVAMVEAGDFGCETSSKSTKLLHGGVRYLEKAFKSLDLTSFKLVIEALRERKHVLDSMPYLTKPIALMLPVYSKMMVPYFLLGLKLYDYFSWNKSLGASHFINEGETLRHFPNIKLSNLKGSIVYYDGIHDDSRTNLMVALTAAYYNADILNYSPVKRLIKRDGVVIGAVCQDEIGNEEFSVRARCVISTAGPFTDQIKKMADGKSEDLVVPSSGVHIVVPKEYGANGMGLINPSTSDKRVLFFIPWLDKTIIGCTDSPCKVERAPVPKDEEISYILDEANKFLKEDKKLEKKNVLSAWCGIRPLVTDPKQKSTKNLARNHIVHLTDEKLLVLAGGKWTTYRKMAEDAIDMAIKKFHLNPARPCVTEHVKMLGSHGFSKQLHADIQRELDVNEDEARHFITRYGDRSFIFSNYKDNEMPLKRLHSSYMYTEEEVCYSIDHEMACKPADVLMRRMRLGFLDIKACVSVVDRVCRIFREKLSWSRSKMRKEKKECLKMLESLGSGLLN